MVHVYKDTRKQFHYYITETTYLYLNIFLKLRPHLRALHLTN